MTAATGQRDILLSAAAAVQAADAGKPARIEIVAYTGGLMTVAGFGPVCIDLGGLALPDQVPLLADHENALRGVAGFGVPAVRKGTLVIVGEIVRDSAAGQQVVGLAKAGMKLSASVGVEVLARRHVGGGETITANGKTIKAPPGGLLLVSKGRLREVSLLPFGADFETSVNIAAQAAKMNGEMNMPEMNVAEIRAAERERLNQIEAACKGMTGQTGADLKARAIGEEITLADLQGGLLDVLRASRPTPPAVRVHADAPTSTILAAAVLLHTGFAGVAEKQFGAVACQRATDLRARSLCDIAAQCLLMEGRTVPRTAGGIITAGFSTMNLPVALGDSASKVILQTYTDSPASWAGFGNVVNVADFKTNSVIRPSFSGELLPVPAGGEVKHGFLGENVATVKADTFAQLLTVSRQDVINDSGGLFLQAAGALGRNAARAVADLVYQVLLANAGGFFAGGHGNLQTGGTSVLLPASLAIAIAAVIAQRDANGRDLDIVPAVLLVPPELDQAARQLLTSMEVARYVTAGTDNVPTGNPFKGQLALAVEPRLSNSVRFTGSSATAWYIFAGPAAAGLNVAFLGGVRVPTVESFGPSDQVDRLAFSWRVFHDFGAGLGDFRAGYKSNGA